MGNTRYFIFARIGGKYGMGHVTRMRSLVKSFRRLNCNVSLISDVDELKETRNVTGKVVTIIDDKYIDDYFLLSNMIYRDNNSVISVDDPCERITRSNLVVMPNMHMTYNDIIKVYKHQPRENILFGEDYILMNDEVRSVEIKPYKSRPEGYVCFYCGGSTGNNELKQMIDFWGDGHPHIKPLFIAHDELSHEEISNYRMMFCMWGVTVYEALSLGVPVVAFLRDEADIERASTLSINTEDALMYGYSLKNLTKERFINLVLHYMLREEKRVAKASKNGTKFIKRDGADNLAKLLVGRFG